MNKYQCIYDECNNMFMDFPDWLQGKMDEEGLSQNKLAEKAGLSQGAINHVLLGGRKPGKKFIAGMSQAFNIPPEEIYRQAGLISSVSEPTKQRERLNFLFDQFPDGEKDELLTYMELKLEILKKQGKIKS